MGSSEAVAHNGLPIPPAKHPFRTTKISAMTWYRVHRYEASTGKFAPNQFNPTTIGDARFSPLIDPATNNVIPTLYAAQKPEGAIAEIVLHDVPTPSAGYLHDWERDKAGDLHLSEIELGDAHLVNLTAMGLKAPGLSVADLFGTDATDYPRTRQWAAYIWRTMPTAQGLYWMSVRDNRCGVVMLFGDRFAANTIKDLGRSRPIAEFESVVVEMLDQMGCGIALS